MSALSPAQLKHAFKSSQSGRGFHLVGIEQLKAFTAMFARLDLSIYQGGQDDQARPPSAEAIDRYLSKQARADD